MTINRSIVMLSICVLGAPRVYAQQWMLVYAGRGRAYGARQFTHILYPAEARHAIFDGIVTLDGDSPRGHSFTSWAKGPPLQSDYWEYLDSLFAPGGPLRTADSIAQAHADTLLLAVMVPYPLGKVQRSPPGDPRISFIGAYLTRAESLFAARQYHALRLWGFYWLPEAVSAGDTLIVQRFTTLVRWQGLKTLWIPTYLGGGAMDWRRLGFDRAYLQPNYFFYPDVQATRLDSAVNRASALAMGLEIEFDKRLLADTVYRRRLEPYLAVLEGQSGKDLRSIAVYDGAGAMDQLAGSEDPYLKALYGRLVSIIVRR
jgi:Domain of unknown function (DUF4855)